MTKGFTLIELLVYTALLAIVLSSTFLFAISIMTNTAKSSIRDNIHRSAANILRTFDFEVRHAESVYTPTSDFASNPGRLSLATTRNLPKGETRGYVDIYEDNGRLCIKREISGVSCITSADMDVTSLSFVRIQQAGGQESVQIRFTVQNDHVNADLQIPQTVQTTARLRSY
jgi:prepilin-type N-terminal cleavage/methylation domain-containing protein